MILASTFFLIHLIHLCRYIHQESSLPKFQMICILYSEVMQNYVCYIAPYAILLTIESCLWRSHVYLAL